MSLSPIFKPQKMLTAITSLTLLLLLFYSVFSPAAYAIDCEELNKRIKEANIFIDKSVLTQYQHDRILQVFLANFDPYKIFFLQDDIAFATELFGFDEIDGGLLSIDCNRIDGIALLFEERLIDALEYVNTLTYHDVAPISERSFKYFYEADDFP
ncbi:MAG: hypothetical protein OXC40_00170, partial [Proteobacteria bacterium]|nr:hypothetical protein [Pseudomonadota bacterium]